MIALKPVAFLLAALAAGAVLAVVGLAAGLPIGWIGAVALVGWAFAARRRWAGLEATSGLEPGAPERFLWLRLAGASLVLGQLVTAILLVRDDLRIGNGNSLAIDSWTLLVAEFIVTFAFSRDRSECDERHDAILARGVRAGYAALVAAVIALLAWLAYAPAPLRTALTDFVLANVLVALILASYSVMVFVQLVVYARDTREARTELKSR